MEINLRSTLMYSAAPFSAGRRKDLRRKQRRVAQKVVSPESAILAVRVGIAAWRLWEKRACFASAARSLSVSGTAPPPRQTACRQASCGRGKPLNSRTNERSHSATRPTKQRDRKPPFSCKFSFARIRDTILPYSSSTLVVYCGIGYRL